MVPRVLNQLDTFLIKFVNQVEVLVPRVLNQLDTFLIKFVNQVEVLVRKVLNQLDTFLIKLLNQSDTELAILSVLSSTSLIVSVKNSLVAFFNSVNALEVNFKAFEPISKNHSEMASISLSPILITVLIRSDTAFTSPSHIPSITFSPINFTFSAGECIPSSSQKESISAFTHVTIKDGIAAIPAIKPLPIPSKTFKPNESQSPFLNACSIGLHISPNISPKYSPKYLNGLVNASPTALQSASINLPTIHPTSVPIAAPIPAPIGPPIIAPIAVPNASPTPVDTFDQSLAFIAPIISSTNQAIKPPIAVPIAAPAGPPTTSPIAAPRPMPTGYCIPDQSPVVSPFVILSINHPANALMPAPTIAPTGPPAI